MKQSDIAFNSYSFSRANERAESILNKIQSIAGFENTPLNEITSLFSNNETQKELQLLEAEIERLKKLST